MVPHLELIARIACGAAFGGIIGYERDRHGRPVGLRTHLIVAMAAATFMVLSEQFVYYQHYKAGDFVSVDASRIASTVVSGIGFLAGGAILRTGLSVQGLTTAAGLWLVTATGMCAGAGMYFEGLFVTAMGIATLTIVRRFEDKDDRLLQRRVFIVLAGTESTTATLDALTNLGVVLAEVEYQRWLGDDQKLELVLDVQVPIHVGLPALVEAIEVVPGVRRVRVGNTPM